jgi:hypothetical protein
MRYLLATLLLAQGAPSEEYQEKLRKISRNAAAKHYSIAQYLGTSQMHLWAREQLNKVVELDPDHADARKRLGYAKGEDGQWVSDPAIKQEFGNRKKGADADRVAKSMQERLEQAGKDLSRQWGDLAFWCKKEKLEAETESAFRKALEYDPLNSSARKELGYEKDAKGVWISKFERELRKEMRDGIAKAPAGAASAGVSEVAKAMGQAHKRRESEHFAAESPHLAEAQLGGLLQHAEHVYAVFHKLFGQENLFGGQKKVFVALKDKAQHERYVSLFYRGASPAHVELARKSRALGGWPVAELYQDTAPELMLHDWVIHSTTESLFRRWVGGEHCWLIEGLALHFTRLMKDTAMLHCVDLAGTTPQNKGKNYSDPSDWPVVCRVWVRENKDPELMAILKCDNFAELDGAETVKAWSLVEFLLAEQRPKFIEFLGALKGGVDVETALRSVWGWTVADLDFRWKQYVRTAY